MHTETRRHPRAHLRPGSIALVFVGGTVGVLARELLMLALPEVGAAPLGVLVANLVGALLLGVLLSALAGAPRQLPVFDRLRLLLGTGLLGGFTTYSALAQVIVLLLAENEALLALGYGLATVLLGGLASWCGIVVGAALSRRTGGGVD